ncbi:MAG: long-chain fatty acid--CoA ligase [Candidatus Pelagibacter sp.]|nr:long-chain fatty acid--CoA ligase [Candidatus Pelagibacter sp.]|tara:strand:+ start:40928 stop:42646 length:1719 start_codon:yes stop_codon:yes gene_type:complete
MNNLNKKQNLLELFLNQYDIQLDKKKILLSSLKEPKKNFTWQDTLNFIVNLSKEISKYTVKGDRCLIISENRPEWLISDFSVMLSGLITVPAYTTYSESDYDYIINDCKPSVIFVSNIDQFIKIEKIIKNKDFIKKIFTFEDFDSTYKNEYQNINNIIISNKYENNITIPNINRTDPACIIYTSGTQGNPKGVILSHGGILNNCQGAIEILKPLLSKKKQIRFLTWLPLSHSYEHTVQFAQITVGARIFYAESIDKLIKNMNECNPDIMTAVPRFYQNLYQKINSSFNKSKGLKKILINKMLFIGKKRIKKENLNFNEKILDYIFDKIIRKKIKAQFGGSIKAFVSGGGALDKNVGYFLNAIGLPTLQGYGLTETSPVVSCNPLNDIRVETVGPPFEGNEVKLADDGEILVKGENVMLGYWNNKEETNKVLKDGWLYTGDIGFFKDNYLQITDRKKDIIITPGGDNISPVKIETEITNSYLFDQAIVYGDNKPYLVALLVLNNDIILNDEKKIELEIERINKKLSKIENIKKFFVIKEKFSIENGMLTPTLKLKRFKIVNKYKKNFEKLYTN